MSDRVLVTGSSGFIGEHLCAALGAGGRAPLGVDRLAPADPRGHETVIADLRDAAALAPVAARGPWPVVAHLAAEAEVVIPFETVGDVMATNINGTINLLDALDPRLVVFTSTSAVYGNSRPAGAAPGWDEVAPLGVYGISKACGEMLGRDWARERERAFVSLRLGNVVGPGCRGLIPYLVRHAVDDPEARRAVELRGAGRLVRDYVPVEYVVALVRAAADTRRAAGTLTLLNAGTGRGLSNRDVTDVVAGVLRGHGLALRADYDRPAAPGEADHVVLDMRPTVEALGVEPPPPDAVVASIEAATLDHLERITAGASADPKRAR